MNAPKLRFKCFQDEWKNIDLSKCFEYFSTNSLSRDSLSNEGVIKNIHYGDIHRKFNSIVDANVDIDTYIKDINYINKNELLKENDLIFADASEDYEGIGKSIEIINVGNNNIVAGLHTILARETNKFFSPKFKGYYFNSTVIHNQIRVLANGFKVFGISKTTINSIDAKIPSLVEQEKISNTLYLLDKKIELQSKKIEALKLYKLCIRKRLFDELNEYDTMKIKDVLNFEQPTKYIVNSTEYLEDSKLIPVLTANKAFILGYCDEKNTYNKGESIIFDDFTMDMKYVNFEYKIKSSAIKILTSKSNFNLKYIFELLDSMKLYSEDHKRHYISFVQELCVKVPNISVQDKIADELNLINKKIQLNTKLLTNIQTLKKGLMQNMFI